MQKLMGLVRRCVDDYDMIRQGDKIAVGVSGGKDSLVLLVLLAGLREYFDKACREIVLHKIDLFGSAGRAHNEI